MSVGRSQSIKLPTLLTFAPMIDSELTRLILAHYGIAYQESDHLFGWVSLITLLHGGYGRIPILYGQGLHITGPRPIVDQFEPKATLDRKLLPLTQPERQKVEAYWNQLDGQMAFDTAVVSYFHLLPERDLMIRTFARRIPSLESKLLPTFYGALRMLFTLLLRLGPARASDALSRIRKLFDQTDKRLASGGYLVGDRLTLADLRLVSWAAPLLLPGASYGAPMPNFDELPSALQAIVRELRDHPTAAYVARFYASRPISKPVPSL